MRKQRVDAAVRRETWYISLWTIGLSVLMQLTFLLIGQWDVTVLLGNLLSLVLAIANFFLMGLGVQKAVMQEEKRASATIRTSQLLRMVLLFAVAAMGVLLDCFSPWAVLIPLFFPRLALVFRPLFPMGTESSASQQEGGDDA